MANTKFFLLGLIMIELFSCTDNRATKQEVQGVVLDNQTGKPIPKAQITILSWRKVRYDEDTYDKIDTVADENGKFQLTFTNSYKIDLGSVAPNYQPIAKEISSPKLSNTVELKLKRSPNQALAKDMGELAVFTRNYHLNDNRQTEYYGIDILNGVNRKPVDSIDVGIEKDKSANYPNVLIANKKGGIFPFFKNSNIDPNKAPTTGYVKKYQLTGNEQGFFILCRDGRTYSRLMISSLEYDRSTPYKNGFYKDYGIMFKVLMQPSGYEFNIANSFRLDYYILENI
jgi:hypothetical protein